MYILDLLGVLAFAISGAFKAKGLKLNIFGVVFLGFITAVGGGTVRDLIIGRAPLFYLTDPNYILISTIGGALAYFIPTFFKRRFTFFRFLDSIGLATFAIIGVSVTSHHLFNSNLSITLLSFLVSISLGVLTASGGGILRDAIMGDTPFALKHGSNYISSAFFGSLIFYLLSFLNLQLAITFSMIITLYLREVKSNFGVYKKVFKNKKNGIQ